ncbi:putative Murein lipoprotein (Modular protein) [Nitrospira japonica]|uniref:Putative Murein lipoprotein (Modular protein) n=1 Tax=Nitrospira japonica TaxID=1325564 RepID=A0A1W1I948_9BACT|nr:hypothetical protein [Nitrospira japonica]SLM49547.1 putative Murein lipoprotein (Modular protein) [Nitrospira japonica]
MTLATRVMKHGVAILAVGCMLTLAGCDYWPPALQTQIEQLRSELQTVTAEKSQLQTQLASIAKVKDDLQVQVDDLSRANRDKSAMIANLQNSVTSLQERVHKTSKAGASKAVPAKAHAKAKPKTVVKTSAKKRPAAKATAQR